MQALKKPNQTANIKVSVCITAYNEEKNIGKLLSALRLQTLHDVVISEIILVASGCTDNTVKIAKESDKNVIIIEEERRSGKASAINLFLQLAKEKVCVLISADVIPFPKTVESLCEPFFDPEVGMTAAHPVPSNSSRTFTGFCVKTMWELHHELSLISPKCGEMVAFRKTFPAIPADSAVDEASIEQLVVNGGARLVYVPDALVTNKGPTSVREFIAQRRRINCGHIWLAHKFNYRPSTLNPWRIAGLTFGHFSFSPQHNLWIFGMIFLEIWAKILARIDFMFKKQSYTIWNPISSSKDP